MDPFREPRVWRKIHSPCLDTTCWTQDKSNQPHLQLLFERNTLGPDLIRDSFAKVGVGKFFGGYSTTLHEHLHHLEWLGESGGFKEPDGPITSDIGRPRPRKISHQAVWNEQFRCASWSVEIFREMKMATCPSWYLGGVVTIKIDTEDSQCQIELMIFSFTMQEFTRLTVMAVLWSLLIVLNGTLCFWFLAGHIQR